MTSEALEKLCEASIQTLPWIWVIEALASYKSVDASILIHLYKNCPDISGEMGKQAREIVSLRILESLAAVDNQDVDSIPNTSERIGFDPRETCEDVLQQILDDGAASKVKNGGLKMSKWDVQSFIAIKRARINSFSLQKLKVAILEGKHSVLESLKERSGITDRTRYNNNTPANGGHTDEFVPRHEDSNKIMDAVGPSTTSNFTSTEKCDKQLQENVPERNVLPAKRNRSGVTAKNLEGQTYNTTTTGYYCDPERKSAKKHKQAENGPRHDSVDVMITASQNDQPVKPSELMEVVETEVHKLDKEAEVEHSEFEFVITPNNLEAQETQLWSPTNPVDQDIGRKFSSQMQGQTDKIGEGHSDSEGHGLRTSNATSLAAIEAPTTVDKAIKLKHDYHAPGAAETKDHIEHDQEPEAISDSDEYHEEASDINLMKNAFLSSQCTHSQDSLPTQLKHCMKCNKSGNLLVCSSNKCPIVLHENCLGSTDNFDCEGRFYCPFCVYSRAISEYMEAKKRISKARCGFSIFTGVKVGSRLKLSEESHKSQGNQSKMNDNLPKTNVPNNHIALSSKIDQKHSHSNREGVQKTKPSVPQSKDSNPFIEKLVDVTHEAPVISESDRDPGQEQRSQCIHGVPLKISDGVISSDLEIGSCDVNGKGKHNRIRECHKTGFELASPADAPFEPTDSIEEEESAKSAGSDHNIRSKGTPKGNYPAIPQPRRKKLPWTSLEEEKLKEGVKFFRVDDDPTIPWKQIMEFGAGVFQKGRTTVDLKDKWRNICKKEVQN